MDGPSTASRRRSSSDSQNNRLLPIRLDLEGVAMGLRRFRLVGLDRGVNTAAFPSGQGGDERTNSVQRRWTLDPGYDADGEPRVGLD